MSFPLVVQYCGVCGLTPELCSSDPKKYPQCKPWLEKNAPQFLVEDLAGGVAGLSLGGGGGGDGSASGSSAPAGEAAAAGGGGGGGGVKVAEKKVAVAKPKVVIQVREEGKRVTTAISGLDPFCSKLKEAASALAKKVGAGASVRPQPANPNINEVVIQVRQPNIRDTPEPRAPRPHTLSPLSFAIVQGDITDSLEDLLVSLFKVPESAIVFK